MHPLTLLKLSRPRFWLYTLGPFSLPLFAAGSDIVHIWPTLLLAFLYFSFPANLFIYGVNDIFDRETDALNTKKDGYELRLKEKQIPFLIRAIAISNIPFLAILFLLAPQVIPTIGFFLFLSFAYSAPPIRAKTKPFLDGVFNTLYLMPGVMSALLLFGDTLSWSPIFAGILWCMAMHAFSAVPDIDADRKAHMPTTATTLGKTYTLLYCAILWTGAALLATGQVGLGYTPLLILPLYLLMLMIALNPIHLFRAYRAFPLLNTFSGFLLALALLGFL